MSATTLLLLTLAGGVGSALRYAVGRALDRGWHVGTLLVNLVGSALLGGLSAAASPTLVAVLGVGLCGGLTTYSAFAVQSVEQGPRRGAAYVVVTIAGCLCAAAAGWLVASAA